MKSKTHPISSHKTGLVYDPIFLGHCKPGHPERPERLTAIREALIRSGLLDELNPVPARPASMDDLRLVHNSSYIQQVQNASLQGYGQLDPDTYVNRHSCDAAMRAAGGLIDLSKAVFQGDLQNGFALVRPPGHHALPDRAMGFCIFNNVAVAAKALLREMDIKRIAIVDFDVHHGNGSQTVFESDPSVLYISTHQSPHYPGTGFWNESGSGDAKGSIVNIPLPSGTGDNAILQCYESIVIPKLKVFCPRMIFVSAGYDAHWRDPLAGLMLSSTGLARISFMLVEAALTLCSGRIVFSLEGGYNLETLGHGAVNTFRALMGRNDFSDPFGPAPRSALLNEGFIDQLKQYHHLV